MEVWYRERGKWGRAPEEIKVFERALRFKRSPEEVRRFSDGVLMLAEAMGVRDPAEIEGWPIDDRNNLLMVLEAQILAAQDTEKVRDAGS